MISARDKKVLLTSLYVSASFIAAGSINFLLDGRVPSGVRLGLAAWVLRLFYYGEPGADRSGGFIKWAWRNALYVPIFVVLYYLIRYLWRLFYPSF
ncbi:MAG TPA: hypothetical protein VGW12_05175 [Pyrinomonadaceae bacterium]|nr:hypothetical protein [Pyrinomonadaceae bacterium]